MFYTSKCAAFKSNGGEEEGTEVGTLVAVELGKRFLSKWKTGAFNVLHSYIQY